MNNEEKIKINILARTIGTELIKRGISIIRNGNDFNPVPGDLRIINDAFDKIEIPISVDDIGFMFTNWNNWQEIIKIINIIIRYFPWQEEVGDCDDRSAFACELTVFCFKLNTIGRIYCEVKTNGKTFLHKANVIVCPDGQLYLWDIDNGGMTAKITSKNIVIGNWNYSLISARFI